MLKSIDIKGLAVVEQLNLELQQGMTVLTGETGAGKSILLTAMKLCLGDRADATLLRPGVEKADISLDFDIAQRVPALNWLQQNELEDNKECIIRRTINADGRSRAFINGQAVNLKSLQQLSGHLISIHGQHAHLDLLQAHKQCELLDNHQTSKDALYGCHAAYDQWKKLHSELQLLTEGNDDNGSEKQLLKYQIQELEQADIIHINYDELVRDHSLASNMNKIIELAEKQTDVLYEHETNSIHTQLGRSAHELALLAELSPIFQPLSEQINEAVIQIQETSRDLRHQIDQQETDPENLNLLDKQLSKIHDLARKLHIEPQQLLENFNSLVSRLDMLENRDERLSSLQQEISQALHSYQKIVKTLHLKRVKTAAKLSEKITVILKTLGLPDGQLTIKVSPILNEQPRRNGLDDISFLVTTNPGMPQSPIGKVASGGELSRISLAIQVVTSQNNTTPTLIFDEVDAGIGGGVAETVGLCLREIASDRQVLCVTHLPQVASQGHQHLYVSKNQQEQKTKTEISLLNTEKRIEEVARMLGGIDVSDKTIAHAKEMVENAI
ncbi:MAG: DNA repair protein RecN [Cycloclasticus sp.]|nr:MAG: DNA repair protein RecN [Cycloclasticus sp.]